MSYSNPFKEVSACWIWPEKYESANQYMQFRQEFVLDTVHGDSQIIISSDTSYALWLNGCFVHHGQFHDWPWEKTYDILEISEFLKSGKNVLCVLSYYQGQNSAQYICSEPGIVYAIKSNGEAVISGFDTYWRQDESYRTEGLARITPQLHFSFEYDSRAGDNWLEADYMAVSNWKRIQKQDINPEIYAKTFKLRPVKSTQIKERAAVQIITQGFFKNIAAEKDVARQMQYAFLSYRNASDVFGGSTAIFPISIKTPQADSDGVYLIADLYKEEVGLFEIELDADTGTVIDIAYGEHLDDMRVRAFVGGRNFANRFISKQGRQTFTHYFTRFAGRYLQLHISGSKSSCKLHYAGLRRVEYPVELKSEFISSCQLQNAIYKTSVRTLQLSMHEHYEDCPWREQALYANDARNQALCGYYCFGEYGFPGASLDLLGKGLKSDGYLELCAPAEISVTIPSFSLVLIMALADHLLYSGNVKYAADQFPIVKKILGSQMASMVNGLLPSTRGKRYFQFYDWADGLDGTVAGDCTNFSEVCGLRFDAPMHMFFCLAMESAALIAQYVGDDEYAKLMQCQTGKLKKAIHSKFFDADAGLYLTYAGDTETPQHYAELTQALAILAKICSDEYAECLRYKLSDDKSNMVKTTLSQSLYKFEALLTDKSKYSKYVFDKINADWGGMLLNGATSFWETLKGASDFDNAGSLCHGWSATPVYFYYAHLLGIRPVEPGFKKFIFAPSLNAINTIDARIATPHGAIGIKLQRIDDRLVGQLDYPGQLEPVLMPSSAKNEVKLCSYQEKVCTP